MIAFFIYYVSYSANSWATFVCSISLIAALFIPLFFELNKLQPANKGTHNKRSKARQRNFFNPFIQFLLLIIFMITQYEIYVNLYHIACLFVMKNTKFVI